MEFHEDAPPSPDGRREHEAIATEKLACENCRHRKYLVGALLRSMMRRWRTDRATSENKIDRIAERIEELNQTVRHLSITQPTPIPDNHFGISQPARTPSSPHSLQPTPSSSAATPSDAHCGHGYEKPPESSRPEYEGESSLFAHSVFATRFLQNAINNNPSSEVALEMNSVLDALRSVINGQKQQTDTIENLYPHARPLPPGSSLRNLPLPSTEKALACIRMAQENQRIQLLWLMEFQTISQFTTHFIKVCSPGPATQADLIIVCAGLYWLFCECMNTIVDETLKKDYESQALIARDSPETVLSNLPFHLPTTLEYVYALSMATLYCVQKCKPSAAWNFISVASNLSQSLGLHSSVPLHAESPEVKQQKTRLFWTIYATEKMLALRIGRSSTIRENDITVPRMGYEISSDPFLNKMFPIWIGMSAIQGRIYEDIYSPISLAQPESVRMTRARTLADELGKLIEAEDDLKIRYSQETTRVLGTALSQLIWRAERVTALSMLTLIYRSIPPEKPGGSVFCEDCIATAREAVMEHEKCVNFLTDEKFLSSYFELYINWAFLQSPFIPFIVLFCHMVEASDPADLRCLGNLVETLQSVSRNAHYSICQKQLSIFKALYDVAVRYFDVKAAAERGSMLSSQDLAFNPYANTPNTDAGGVASSRSHGMSNVPMTIPVPGLSGSGQGTVDPLSQIPMFEPRNNQFAQQASLAGDFGMEMDPPTAELANWFYTNHQMMRILEDT
ncbi:C6 transcription factor [Fusarium albosuccineum]|uniref:C6 transcription factor n=1 Tax=Fusarium albosuccineum TaxID=1237068 RepID=A0A8H4LA31_9HYPO|nr:C6 transcription factor [Fusarium albosuccineum]